MGTGCSRERHAAGHDESTDQLGRPLVSEPDGDEMAKQPLRRFGVNMVTWQAVRFLQRIDSCLRSALRFFQIEKQINAAIDLRIAAALPLIK